MYFNSIKELENTELVRTVLEEVARSITSDMLKNNNDFSPQQKEKIKAVVLGEIYREISRDLKGLIEKILPHVIENYTRELAISNESDNNLPEVF